MSNKTMVVLGVCVLVAIAVFVAWRYAATPAGQPVPSNPSSTPGGANGAYLQNITLAGGEIALTYPDTYALAVTPVQVLVHPYIPPCDQEFDYCLYYQGSQYEGTNFESAGLRIKRRPDLANERLCLETPPQGFSASTVPAGRGSASLYSTSVFMVSGAGAGHVAEGQLYRLFLRVTSSCYEFETRVGTTQFGNYPSGTIREFTASDRQAVKASLRAILDSGTIGGEGVAFPVAN
jgi:hypothetical protein